MNPAVERRARGEAFRDSNSQIANEYGHTAAAVRLNGSCGRAVVPSAAFEWVPIVPIHRGKSEDDAGNNCQGSDCERTPRILHSRDGPGLGSALVKHHTANRTPAVCWIRVHVDRSRACEIQVWTRQTRHEFKGQMACRCRRERGQPSAWRRRDLSGKLSGQPEWAPAV